MAPRSHNFYYAKSRWLPRRRRRGRRKEEKLNKILMELSKIIKFDYFIQIAVTTGDGDGEGGGGWYCRGGCLPIRRH